MPCGVVSPIAIKNGFLLNDARSFYVDDKTGYVAFASRVGLTPSPTCLRRCGFKNVARGVLRIDGVCHGDLNSQAAKMVLDALPAALEMGKDAVETAVRDTTEIMAEVEVRPRLNVKRLGGRRSRPGAVHSRNDSAATSEAVER